MSGRRLTNLVGERFGPFEVIVDERHKFEDPVTARTTCCGRVVANKTVFSLNTSRWRNGRVCLECVRAVWKGFTRQERATVARARLHGCVDTWTGRDGSRRMLDHLGPRPSVRHCLGFRDPKRPHGPGNSAWMLEADLRIVRGSVKAAHAPDGSITTQAGAARLLGMTREAVRQRQRRGWTLDEATMTPKGEVPARVRALRGTGSTSSK